MKTAKTVRVITSLADVPATYRPLSSYRKRGRNGRKTVAYMALHHAYADGKLDAVKLFRGPRDLRGPVFVDPDQAAAIIDRLEAIAPRRESTPAPEPTPAPKPNPAEAPTDGRHHFFVVRPEVARAAWEIHRAAVLGILNAAERIATALEAAAPRNEAHAEIATAIDNLTAAVREDDVREDWTPGTGGATS